MKPHAPMQVMAVVLALSITGCSTMKKVERVSGEPPVFVYYAKKAFQVRNNTADGVGKESRPFEAKFRDSTRYYAVQSGFVMKEGDVTYYLTTVGMDSVWMRKGDVYTADDFDFMLAGGTVKLPRSQSDDAWSRATKWLSENSDMKLQHSTDYLLETFNPAKGRYGYTISRRLEGEWVFIEIKCHYGYSQYETGDCESKEKKAYHFIKYGRWVR